MTTTEFRKIIAKSEDPNWFKSVLVTFEYPHIEFSQTLKGFSSIHKFLSQQIDGWEKYETIPNVLESSKQNFTNLRNRLDSFISHYHTQTEPNLESYWSSEKRQFQNNSNFFIYESPYTLFLIDLHKRLPNSVTGAYNYIIKTNTNLNDRNNFIGVILAYEFDLKDKATITERRKKEKISFSKIKNDFRNQLSESEIQLTEHLANANQEYEKYVKEIDGFKTEKETLFNDWFNKSKENFTAFDSESKDKITDLEKTYEELLRLKKPAEYWKTRAITLKKEGWKAINWMIGLVAFACLTLYLLLWLTPEGMLLSFIKGNAQAIKWSVIYVTFISFLAYGIRTLHKVAFSSFHLARDAEEREQLTYFYLALIKDKAVDEKDKNLIMQSLFSRADTGLLKDDSGPTMPNDIAGKIFGR